MAPWKRWQDWTNLVIGRWVAAAHLRTEAFPAPGGAGRRHQAY